MTIKDFSLLLGITDSTVRYYERIGVLQPIHRQKNGYREFSHLDVGWMEFVLRLKTTGMPVDQIVDFAHLRDLGDSTAPQRLKMLQEHEARIFKELENQKRNLEKIQEKIKYYKKLAEDLP